MRQTELSLTKQERNAVAASRSKGAYRAREFNLAIFAIPRQNIML